MFGDRLAQLLFFSTYLWGTMLASENLAQIIPDNSLEGENSILTENTSINGQVVDLIEGGADRDQSLFHSFDEFNVLPGQQVYFANPQGIDNILTRVTGNNVSEIFGQLGVNGAANLFLLNPNGIVFGENASLDVAGSFLATTADSFILQDNTLYSATNPEVAPLLEINIPQGLQFGSAVGSIEVQGIGNQLEIDPSTLMPILDLRPSGLEISTQRSLALIGGELNLNGGNLTALGGKIELASIAQSGQVGLKQENQAIALDYENINIYDDINLTQGASIDISENQVGTGEKKGAGSLELRGQNITLQNGSAIIASEIRPGNSNQSEINIVASDSLNIIGDNTSSFPSAIFTQTEAQANKQGIDINIETTNLNLQNNALIISTVASKADGGNINIVAQQADFIDNSSSPYGTGVFSQVLSGASGDGGIVIVELTDLPLLNNGQTISQLDDEEDLENLIGEDRAEDLEDFIEDNEDKDIIVGVSEINERKTLVLQGGGQISYSNNGEGKSGVAIVSAENIKLFDAIELEEVLEPIEEEDEDSIEEVLEPIEEEDEDSIEEVLEPIEEEEKISQPKTKEDSSTEKTYIFKLDNGKNFIVSAKDLRRVSVEGSISDANNVASEESETIKIFINGLLTSKSFNPNFDLTSACRIGDSNFISVGRGGLPANPLEEVTDNTFLSDLESFSQSAQNISNSKALDFALSNSNPILEAQNWKINKNGKVELVATSIQSDLTHINQINCSKN